MVRLFGTANFPEVGKCVSGFYLLLQEMALEGS